MRRSSSCGKDFRRIFGNGGFELTRLGVQGFKLFVQCFELFLEVLIAHILAGCYADVAAGVERPALCFDFLDRRAHV